MSIGIVYYSMYGTTFQLAQEIASGIRDAGGDPQFRKVEELVPEHLLDDNAKAAREAQADISMATVDELPEFDGIIFGAPTRFGNRSAQLSQFLDQTGGLWQSGALAGKPAGFFTGAATAHGGHESTIITMSTYAYHQGMVIVPVGYTLAEVQSTESGGGPYGPTHQTPPDGSKTELTADEKAIGRGYGTRFAEITAKLSA